MTKRAKKMNNNHLRVKYAEADRVRELLLATDVHTLSKRDVQILLQILNDVYPVRKRKSRFLWQPLLIGIGIGLILVIGMALML